MGMAFKLLKFERETYISAILFFLVGGGGGGGAAVFNMRVPAIRAGNNTHTTYSMVHPASKIPQQVKLEQMGRP